MIKKETRKGFKMKTLIIAILLLISTMSIRAKTSDMYQHTIDIKTSSLSHKSIKNNTKQLLSITKNAKRGDIEAQFELAMMYAFGNGVAKNEKVAFSWFHKSARNGHIEAKYYMGLAFLEGRGVKKQLHLAKYWFKLADKAVQN